MVIKISKDGTIEWKFYRKSYRKARWRNAGKRELDWFMKFKKENPEAHGLIIVR
jgi:hypothetical protein